MESNSVAIVSGRPRRDMDRWFGGLARLSMAAEHGALLRPANSAEWEPARAGQSRQWMEGVRAVFQGFTERAPGSFIEEKEYALVWHYRRCPTRTSASCWRRELLATLEGHLAGTELHAISGRKIVEVRPTGCTRARPAGGLSSFAGRRISSSPRETIAPTKTCSRPWIADAWTVHIGAGQSCARLSLTGHWELLALLDRMANPR